MPHRKRRQVIRDRVAHCLMAINAVVFIIVATWFYFQWKENQDARARMQLRDQMFVNLQTAMVVVEGDSGVIVDWNYGAERVLGWKADEVIGYEMLFLLPKELRDRHYNQLLRNPVSRERLKKTLVNVHCWVHTKSGNPLYVELRLQGFEVKDRYYFLARMTKPENEIQHQADIQRPQKRNPMQPKDEGEKKKDVEELLPKAD